MDRHKAAKIALWAIVMCFVFGIFALLMGRSEAKPHLPPAHLHCEEVRKLAGAFDIDLRAGEKLYSVTYIQSTNDLLVCTIKGRSS